MEDKMSSYKTFYAFIMLLVGCSLHEQDLAKSYFPLIKGCEYFIWFSWSYDPVKIYYPEINISYELIDIHINWHEIIFKLNKICLISIKKFLSSI